MSKLIYISVFNFGAIEMAKNHIKSLRKVGITNHCSYVTDEESYHVLKIGLSSAFIKNTTLRRKAPISARPSSTTCPMSATTS